MVQADFRNIDPAFGHGAKEQVANAAGGRQHLGVGPMLVHLQQTQGQTGMVPDVPGALQRRAVPTARRRRLLVHEAPLRRIGSQVAIAILNPR